MNAVPSQPCGLLALRNNQCRWPLGPAHARAELFCGAEQQSGSSYCAEHHALACAPRVARKVQAERKVSRLELLAGR
jgi:hypothetical protein